MRRTAHDDDELNTNPPTPCQISKRPPAPKPKREPAGHQGAAGGGYRYVACYPPTAPDMRIFVVYFEYFELEN